MSYRDRRPISPIQLLITHPSGGDERRISLRITDRTSGAIVADADLTPEQFADLLGTRTVEVDARVPDEVVKARLFRKQEVESRPIPEEIGTRWTYGKDEAVTARVDEWVAKIAEAEGWDTVTVANNSQSFYVTLRRWAPRTEETP